MEWILVVDDDPDIVQLFTSFLESRGYRTTSAQDALQSVIQAQALRPKLVILDILLPVWGSSIASYRALRGDRHLKDLPVIFITALPPHEASALVPLEDPRVRLMHKPVNLSALAGTIQELLGQAGQSAQQPWQRPCA